MYIYVCLNEPIVYVAGIRILEHFHEIIEMDCLCFEVASIIMVPVPPNEDLMRYCKDS